MTDEGVGVHVAEVLGARLGDMQDVEVNPLGTGGMRLLHLLKGHERLIVVDCAKMGTAPGTLRRFTPDEVRTLKVNLRYSLHEADVLSILELAERLGEAPRDVVLFGVEPERVEHGEALSVPLQAAFDDYVNAVAAEVEGKKNNGKS